jgi:hypothetical protein
MDFFLCIAIVPGGLILAAIVLKLIERHLSTSIDNSQTDAK